MSNTNFEEDVLKEVVRLESAYRHQEIALRRSVGEDRLTVGELLHELFGLERESVLSMGIVRNEFVEGGERQEVISNPLDIWKYDLIGCILTRKYEGHYTLGLLSDVSLIVRTTAKPIIFSLVSLGGSDTMKYIRVTILSPSNTSVDDCRATKNSNNYPFITSTIISYSESLNNPQLLEYEKVERAVREKIQATRELDDIEMEFINGLNEFKGYYYLGYAQWLLKQNRFYDAFSQAKRAYNYCKRNFDSEDKSKCEEYYEACNILGESLSRMGRYDEAAFYFNQIEPDIHGGLYNKYIMCLAKLGNPIINDHFEDWVGTFENAKGDLKDDEISVYFADAHIELIEYHKAKSDYIASVGALGNNISFLEMLNTMFCVEKENIRASMSDSQQKEETRNATFKELFKGFFKSSEKRNDAIGMSVYDLQNGVFNNKITDVDEICKMTLNCQEANNKVFILSHSRANDNTNKEDDKSILCSNTPIMVCTHPVKDENGRQLIRVDAVRCNFNLDDDKMDYVRVNEPEQGSCTMTIANERRYGTSKEELLECMDAVVYLSNSGQVLESYKLSKWLYEISLSMLKNEDGRFFDCQDSDLWEFFFESCYRVGFSLMELGRMDMSNYYLEIASHSKMMSHVSEYVNCLCGTKDPKALSVIETIIKNTPKPQMAEELEIWNQNMAFLKRRKAYVLIEQKRYDEAKQMLFEMLPDPENKDFAESELKYIMSLEQQNN